MSRRQKKKPRLRAHQKNKLLNPKIEDDTKGRNLIQFQEDHKVDWQEYTFQEVVYTVAVKAIVAAVDAQYVEELEQNYVSYNNHSIKTMIKQIQKWYVIKRLSLVVMTAQFLDPWRDTPDAHVTTFSPHFYRRQVECENHGVTVTEAKKVDHFVSQMYACNLFKAKSLDDWEESNNKLWGGYTALLHKALR